MQQPTSPDHAAVVHVLSAPRIAARTAPYVSGDTPDFPGLEREAETMSGGESLLVRIARDLWTAERAVGLVEVVHRLDEPNFARVLEALRIARGMYSWDTVEALTAVPRDQDLAA